MYYNNIENKKMALWLEWFRHGTANLIYIGSIPVGASFLYSMLN